MFPFTIEGIVRSLVFDRQLKYGYNETPVFVVNNSYQVAPEGSVFYLVLPFGEDATITEAYDIFGNEITALAGKTLTDGVAFEENISIIKFTSPSAGCFIHLMVMLVTEERIPFLNLVAPALSGTPEVGQTLTCSSGTWSKTATYAYQWYLDDVAVDGETASTYETTAAGDVYCIVTATDNFGTEVAAQSNTETVTEP